MLVPFLAIQECEFLFKIVLCPAHRRLEERMKDRVLSPAIRCARSRSMTFREIV